MKIFKILAPLFMAALLLAGCGNLFGGGEDEESDLKSLVSFKFEAAKNGGVLTADATATYNDVSGKWVVGPLPAGTNVTALVATFALSPLATAKIGGVAQVSGTTANNFTSDVVYVVTAEDGSTANYTISVSVTVSSSAKDISAFALMVGSTLKSAAITDTAIALTVPYGTAVNALVASFTLSHATAVARVGATTQVSATTANDFTAPVSYVVTAQDNSTKTYTVTVTVLPASKLIITEYYEGASGNNKYLELTNTDTVDVDLSAYGLKAYTNGSTTPANALALTGTLPAGKSVVYYNDGYTAATLDTVAAMSATVGDANGWRVPVAYVSGATTISFNGNDAMELVKGGDSMDFIGLLGDAANWGVDIKLIRKPGKLGVQTQAWSGADYYSVPVKTATTGEDDTAGTHTAVYSGSTLSEFWLGGAKGTIAGSTITVIVPEGTAITALVPYFITAAETVQYGAANLNSGTSTVDLSALTPTAVTSPVTGNQYAATFTVSTASPASSTTYTVNFIISSPQVYTATNYSFDGGVQAAFDLLYAKAGSPQTFNLDGSGALTNWGTMYTTYTTSNNGIAVNGAFLTGATTLAVDGIDDGANPIKVGCTFTITGETGTPKHTITAVTATAGKTTGLTFTTALASDVADNAAMTVTAYTAAVNNVGGYATSSGLTTITIDTITDNARPVAAGDVFKVTGETGTPWHTVTGTTVDGSANTITITFTPALGAGAIADNAAVSFAMNPTQNAGTDVSLSGIVTAVASTGQIYIQDQNAAICFYKSSSFGSVKLGDRITISNCRAGKVYNGLVEVTAFGAPVAPSTTAINPDIVVNSSTNAIFYTDATTWVGVKDLKTKRYSGIITTSAATASPYAGVFDATGNNQAFRTFTNNTLFTTTAYPTTRYFYGVIDVNGTAQTSYMLLLTTDQVRAP